MDAEGIRAKKYSRYVGKWDSDSHRKNILSRIQDLTDEQLVFSQGSLEDTYLDLCHDGSYCIFCNSSNDTGSKSYTIFLKDALTPIRLSCHIKCTFEFLAPNSVSFVLDIKKNTDITEVPEK